jgi:hypothetical protein
MNQITLIPITSNFYDTNHTKQLAFAFKNMVTNHLPYRTQFKDMPTIQKQIIYRHIKSQKKKSYQKSFIKLDALKTKSFEVYACRSAYLN